MLLEIITVLTQGFFLLNFLPTCTLSCGKLTSQHHLLHTVTQTQL